MQYNPQYLHSLVGKEVVVVTRDRKIITGILDKCNKEKLYLRSTKNAKQATTSAFFPGFFNPIAPLALFDVLAIAQAPFFFPFI